jgi:hypothetical protein
MDKAAVGGEHGVSRKCSQKSHASMLTSCTEEIRTMTASQVMMIITTSILSYCRCMKRLLGEFTT